MKVLVDMSHRTRNLEPTLSLIYYGTTWTVIYFFFQVLGFLSKMELIVTLSAYPTRIWSTCSFSSFNPTSYHLFCEVTFMAESLFLLFSHQHWWNLHYITRYIMCVISLLYTLNSRDGCHQFFLEYIWVWLSSIYTFTENVYTLNC